MAKYFDPSIEVIDPLDDGDFASDDWIEGQALQAAGLPQLED